MFKRILIIFSLFPPMVLASGNIVKQGSLFEKTEKAYDRYQMITGEILFQKRNNQTHTKGFRPSASKSLGGRVAKSVYDFPRKASPVMLFNSYRSYLSRQGYDFIYECENTACGALPGWKLYLSNYIGGSPSNQYYAAAVRKYDEDKQRKHVVFYISEIDQQPRLVLHEIVGSMAEARFKALPSWKFEDESKLGLMHEVFFETGIHQEFENANFDQFVSSIEQLDENEELVLVGFADPNGSESSNNRLAQKRALNLRNVLVEKHGIDGNRLTALSGGELALPRNSEQSKLSRKVSIYRFNPEAH